MEYADINFPIGSVNPSGIADIAYFAPKTDIAAWPTIEDPDAEEATVDLTANYSGDFTMAAGKTFLKIYSTQGKGKVTAEPIGETDCKMYNNIATLKYPKINKEIRAFAKAAANGDFVFVIKHDGKFFVIGNKDYRCDISPSFDTGDAAGSDKGGTITITCPDVTPMPEYTGELPLADGTLDCSTGVFTPTGTDPEG